MKNMAGLCLFGITLFCVGIFAGRQVKHSLQPPSLMRVSEAPASPGDSTGSNIINTVNAVETGEAVEPSTIRLASFQPPIESSNDEPLRPNEPLQLNPLPQPLEINSETKPATFDIAAPVVSGAPTVSEDTIQIIQNAWPGIDQPTAEAWATEMEGMSREDIEFLLEQRRAAGIRSFGSFLNGSEISKSGTGSSLGSGKAVQEPAAAGPVCPTALQQAIAQSLRNLSGMNALGYRRSVVFLTPCEGNGQAATAFPSWTYSAVRDFRCGELMETFAPLHVALPQDPHLMFVLADSLLTRRGDFTLLAGGRIGLSTGSESYLVDGLEAVPSDCESVSIAVTGVVVAKLPDGAVKSLGRIPIAQIAQPGSMTSDDGVFFRCPAAQMEIVGEKAVVSLQIGFVETANVLSDAEWKTLEHFRKLEQEWIRMMPASTSFSEF